MIQNPVLRGFHPDPSWVRWGEWTYLVTSTFGWLPGLPVYRSKDLCHWEALPPGIPDSQHLDFTGHGCDDGLYAPGIRHDGKRFLLACTLVHRSKQRFVNFLCTSEDPAKGWSAPVLLPETTGRIDPTPFIDPDGSLWLVLNDLPVPEFSHGSTRSIRLWKLHPETFQLLEGPHLLWHGAMVAAATAEAPRLFHKDGFYWLLIAEGGTGSNHAVTMARSRDITGPYTSCPANPLLTHRHLGSREPIQCVGHADLLQREDGSWWGCCLAERRMDGCRLMGRETWFLPVEWEENKWPVFAPGEGRLCHAVPLTAHSESSPPPSPQWISLRAAPDTLAEDLDSQKPFLRARPYAWDDTAHTPALIGKRICESSGEFCIELTPSPGTEAFGISLFCSDRAWIRLEIRGRELRLTSADGTLFASADDVQTSISVVMAFSWTPTVVSARVESGGARYEFPDAVPMDRFAHPVFAGGVMAVWSQGKGGGVHLREM